MGWLCRPNAREKLLYNLSLDIGDTVRVYPLIVFYGPPDLCFQDTSTVVQVVSVDTVVLNGMPRRRLGIEWLFQNQQLEFWIEGIGSTAGFPYTAQRSQLGTFPVSIRTQSH